MERCVERCVESLLGGGGGKRGGRRRVESCVESLLGEEFAGGGGGGEELCGETYGDDEIKTCELLHPGMHENTIRKSWKDDNS